MRATVVSLSEIAKAGGRLDPGYWVALAQMREKTRASGCSVEDLRATLSPEEVRTTLESMQPSPVLKEMLSELPFAQGRGSFPRPCPDLLAEAVRKCPYEAMAAILASMDRLQAETSRDRADLAARETALAGVTARHPHRPR